MGKIDGMIDVTEKPEVYREATASGIIKLKPTTVSRIVKGEIEKGDVFTTARVAGLLAVKNTPQIIPHCHPIPYTGITVTFNVIGDDRIKAMVKVRTTWKTGVEMDALTGVMASLLTIWDMVKKYEKDEHGNYPETFIEEVRVEEKVKLE
ncbi:MAG: cyclic pyranopterin monophosphate synthase MoaC [Desulfurococcales archaeon]|nr:cyclic pyranopterin monophosphate synthase MoaC [Desulfurococcales archaeon]